MLRSRLVSTGMVIVLLLLLILIARPVSAEPVVITVDDLRDDYPDADYTSIQAAVNAASAGDTVYVYPGTYYEARRSYTNKDGHWRMGYLLITKSISVIGADRDTAIIDGRGLGGDVVYIAADNVVFKGFTVRRSGTWYYGWFAILVYGEGVIVQNNIVTDNQNGIYLKNTVDALVRNNLVYSNSHEGIILHMYDPGYKGNNVIDSNEVYNNRVGIYHRYNYGAPGKVTNNQIHDNLYGIEFYYSYNKLIAGNDIWDNKYGIVLRTHGSTVRDNEVADNVYVGIRLDSGNGNNIHSNEVTDNGGNGIVISSSSNNVHRNEIESSKGYGVYLGPSSDSNMVHHNELEDNILGPYLDEGTNNKVFKNET